MTYQEVQDKLAKVEYALTALQSGNHAQYTPEAVQTKQQQLQTLKESLKEKLQVLKEEEGTVRTDDPKKAKDLADDGATVDLVDKIDEGEEQMFDLAQTKLLAKEVAKAVIGGLKDLGDEVSRAVIKDMEPCDFAIHVEYKDGDDDEFVFYCKGDKLHLIDFTFDKEICEVGMKPSGEPILQIDVCKSALITHWKSMNELNEGLSASEIEKIKLMQQFRKGEREDLPDPDSDAYKREKISRLMSKQVSAEEVEYADDNDDTAKTAKGETLSIGDVIEYEGKVYQIRYSYSKGRAHLETTDDNGKDNYGEEGYEKIEGEDPRFAEIVKNSLKVNGYGATKGGFMSEGPYQTAYLKVSRRDYKAAMDILDNNVDPTYAKMDIVDDDGDGNVIIYFNFRGKDDGEPDEDPQSFVYDASMDLQANGIEVVDNSADEINEMSGFIGPFHISDKKSDDELKDLYDKALAGYANHAKGMEYPKWVYKAAYTEAEKILKKRGITVDENAKEDHDGKSSPYGSGFEKIKESSQYTREVGLKIIELIRSSGVDPSDIMNALGKEFGTSIKEGTDLYDKKGLHFKRFAGKGGPALQITVPGMTTLSPNFIQIPGSRLGEFSSALMQAIRVFDDMSRQTPVDEGRDLTDIKKDLDLVKKIAGKINKLPHDDPKRKSFIEKVKKLNKEKQDYEADMHRKVAGKGRDQELNEYTDNSFTGAELIDDVSGRSPDMFGKQIFADLLPKGVASENDAFEALKAHDKSGIKARMGRYAPMFVHMQYHELEHEGEKYRMHQKQYYNSNFKDKDPDFNPGVSAITLMKVDENDEGKNLGTILVKTDQYVEDLRNLPGLGKRHMEEAAIKEPVALKDALERYSLGEILDTAEEFYRENDENDSAELAKQFAKKFRDTLDAFDGGVEEEKRPDYPDVDGDGDTKEPMVKALKDKKK